MRVTSLGRLVLLRAPSEPQRSKILRFGIETAFVLAAAGAMAQLVDYGAFDLRVQALDSNTHASVFGAISLLGLMVAIWAAGLGVVLGVNRRASGLWLVLVLTVILGLRVVHPPHVVLLSAPFTALAFTVLWRGPYADESVRRIIRAGCLALAGSLLVHKFGLQVVSAVGDEQSSWTYQVKAAAKHSLELGGWILVAAGLAAHVAQRHAADTAFPTSIEP